MKKLPSKERTGGRLRRQLSVTTRRELIEAVAAAIELRTAPKKGILDGFVRCWLPSKHAIARLRNQPKPKFVSRDNERGSTTKAFESTDGSFGGPPIGSVQRLRKFFWVARHGGHGT